jgi:arylsulfatase A-like enzyme
MNTLFIMADALRPTNLGCYGYKKNTSPNIDRLARNGVVFKNVIATSPHTVPPVISLMTGLSSAMHGVFNQKTFGEWLKRKPEKTPLHLMQENNIVVDGELVMRYHPLGFKKDTKTEDILSYFQKNSTKRWFFLAEPYSTHLPYNPPDKYYKMFLPSGLEPEKESWDKLSVVKSRLLVYPPGKTSRLEAGEKDVLPDDDIDESHKRTFGIVELTEKERPFIEALYDGEVRVFDDLVGSYIGELSRLGIIDDTLIIITSDHGEELMERGHVGHSSCNLSGTLYDESIKVPLIMHLPKKLPAGKVIDDQIAQIDIMPTLFELLGLDLTTRCDGKSLIPLICSKEKSFREFAFSETIPAGWQALDSDKREMWAVRTNNYKLIVKSQFFSNDFEYEFYELDKDPDELRNCFNPGLTIYKELEKELIGYINLARSSRY